MSATSLEAWLVCRLNSRFAPELKVIARRIRRQAEDAATQREASAAPGTWDTQLLEAGATQVIYSGRVSANFRHESAPEEAG